jgi:hypothetical protein
MVTSGKAASDVVASDGARESDEVLTGARGAVDSVAIAATSSGSDALRTEEQRG